ncbi:sulfotransferase domain-containing protein [Magnetococcales bacterium HHB-1]
MSDILVNLTVFKSGTHLLRQIIQDLTGLPFFEPEIIPGQVNYQDPNQLYHTPGTFYSWHLQPTAEVRQKLMQMNAKPILLLRNIYDLTISIYYHFAHNIDHEIGRGRNVDHYFREMNFEEGIEAIIRGLRRPDFYWRGLAPHLHHSLRMLKLAQAYPSFITSFEKLTQNKSTQIKKLADFLKIPLSEQKLADLIARSSFNAMKAEAKKSPSGVVSHYRQGKVDGHAHLLQSKQKRMIHALLQQETPDLTKMAIKMGFEEIITISG